MNTRMVVTTKRGSAAAPILTPVLDRRRTQETRTRPPSTRPWRSPATRTSRRRPTPNYKPWCDEYFYLKHRNESRGIGGIFYDYLIHSADKGGWDADLAFTQDVGRAFMGIYPGSCAANSRIERTEADRDEQLVRRGRYVEFNLLYDRGTIFGLKTGGNVDHPVVPAAGGEMALIREDGDPRNRGHQRAGAIRRRAV